MTNKFFDYIQPTIIKTSNHPELPEYLRNRYLINFNILGIRYFDQYYLLKESNDGIPYLIMKEDNYGIELEDSLDDYFDKILDIPRIYIDITEKFINGADMFREFFYNAMMENSIYIKGTEEFVAGKDYWLNTTLYNYLANTNQISEPRFEARMPNYLNDIPAITEYFEDISDSPFKDYTNLDYYEKKNGLLDNEYSENDLKDFYKNFCSIILKQTLITDDKRKSGDNPIYDLVLNYYANYQSDAASNALNLVLNSLYSTSDSSSTGCSCNSQFSKFNNSTKQQEDVATKTCSQIYEEAMKQYLKTMLGDVKFYQDWFMIDLSEWECELNDALCESLITFVSEFLEMDFCLDLNNFTTKIHNSLTCTHNVVSSNETKNKNIIENYLKVLEFVQSKNIVQNTNRIKIWGNNFGELLPSLQF